MSSKKIHVSELRTGMFVSKLDRNWLDTPFIMHGFLIESASDVDIVAEFSEYVWVDVNPSAKQLTASLVKPAATQKPGQAPSYQYHFKRSEIWIIVKGIAEIKIDDNVKFHVVGDIIRIPKEAKHQVTNIGETDLVFVEIQLGEYFGEDDIVRLEDKYGRV